MELHELVSKLKELAHTLGKTPTLREFVASGISKRQIQKHKYNEIVRAAGLEVNPSSHTAQSVRVELRPPRILIFDLEVCAATAYTYQFRKAFISPDQVITHPYILSYAAKWLGDDKMYYLDTRFSPRDDRHLLEALHYLLDEADIIVGHNMQRFDLPTTKGRMIMLDMEPLHEHTIWDTFKIAFKHFKFPFYKLSELAKYLKCEKQKLTHAKYPGNSLFIEADKGNMDAFVEMEEYCKMDVLVTEEILLKLMKWEPSINIQAFQQKKICPCGSENFRKDGHKYNKHSVFQRYRCADCGKPFVAKDNLIDKDIRKGLFK